MVLTFLLRDGTGPSRIAGMQETALEWMVGRQLSKPYDTIANCVFGHRFGMADKDEDPSFVAVRIDSFLEAKSIGATRGRSVSITLRHLVA